MCIIPSSPQFLEWSGLLSTADQLRTECVQHRWGELFPTTEGGAEDEGRGELERRTLLQHFDEGNGQDFFQVGRNILILN